MILPALGAAWFVNTSSEAHPVLVMAHTVGAGEVIERDDLTTTALPDDSALPTLAATAADGVIGQRAATDLPYGAVLNEASTVAEVTPAADRAVVGVLLTPAQMPENTLRAGDTVRLVDVPSNEADLSQQTPASTEGIVVSVGAADANGSVVINVDIDAAGAPLLAAHAAIGRVALILDSRER
ncbi:SAF domain-containing protein [Kineococcus sp. SYSU DK003]|uniref:SAF domain-containing protein n=1 Tax=Kineococcus sp. SYSU DK003 TaxID=3383124 RepID=UPI003D7DC9D6